MIEKANKNTPVSAEQVKVFLEEKERLENYMGILKDKIIKMDQDIRGFEKEHSTDPGLQRKIAIKKVSLASTINNLEKIVAENYFLRPPQNDVEYRKKIDENLAKELEQVCPENFRFHGTKIINALDIINQAEISSTVDREGYETSWDPSGVISVTTPETVRTSIEGYMGLWGNKLCQPVGCLFVLLPKDKEDEKAGESMAMGNVDLKSDQFYRVLASREMLPKVREWLKESGFSEDKASEFFEFVKEMKNNKE